MARFLQMLWGTAAFLLMTANMMAAPPTMLKGWGQTSDRDNDCSFEQNGQKLTIRVPAKPGGGWRRGREFLVSAVQRRA